VFGYLGGGIRHRQHDLFSIFSSISGRSGGSKEDDASPSGASWAEGRTILLDTSVIIDGRIADIARTGFLPGSLLIPRFVLNELQYIADSPDSLRRQRGRRGMEVLSSLQREPAIPVRISDIDVEGVREVDDKLVILARQLRCPVLTNDFNLNRVAELQGVTVLNVNEAGKRRQIGDAAGRTAAHPCHSGRQGVRAGRWLHGRRTMVVIESGRETHGSRDRCGGHQSTANRSGPHDLRPP
jgi:uncharacterized protein YacL